MWRLAEDTLGQADLDALAEWLRGAPQLTQGPLVEAFEHAWARWQGSSHAVMVSSGTMANFALTQALTPRGQEQRKKLRIGVAAVTWSTNVTPALLLGHEVVVFDVDRHTLGISEELALEAIKTRAIDVLFVTHLLGFRALTPELIDVAAEREVTLIEDCCEAHGARVGAIKVGSVGWGGTFSFYFGHHMSTVEGGAVVTDDADLADRLRLIRAHGLARESVRFSEYARKHPTIDERFLFVDTGLNLRSSEINAFLGLRQLGTLDARIQMRNENLTHFLSHAPDYIWRDYELEGVSSFALPIVSGDPDRAHRLRQTLNACNIESRPMVAGNLMEQPFLRNREGVRVWRGATPTADHIHRCGSYVGNGHHVTSEMIDGLLAELHTLR